MAKTLMSPERTAMGHILRKSTRDLRRTCGLTSASMARALPETKKGVTGEMGDNSTTPFIDGVGLT